jgi:hypothetical protein
MAAIANGLYEYIYTGMLSWAQSATIRYFDHVFIDENCR